jgi:hypothetical protein
MGLRPTKGDEAAAGRSRRINNSDRVFNRASEIPLERHTASASCRARLGLGWFFENSVFRSFLKIQVVALG